MAYKFKYNERPRSYSEEKHGDEDSLCQGSAGYRSGRKGRQDYKKPPTACMRQRVHCVRGIQFRRNAIYGRSYETGHRPGAGRKKYFRLKNRFA